MLIRNNLLLFAVDDTSKMQKDESKKNRDFVFSRPSVKTQKERIVVLVHGWPYYYQGLYKSHFHDVTATNVC